MNNNIFTEAMKVKNVYYLEPGICDRNKSYYNKAIVVEMQNGKKYLISYSTVVCSINTKGKVVRHWGYDSPTTMKHINTFLHRYNKNGGGVHWWRSQKVKPCDLDYFIKQTIENNRKSYEVTYY